MNDEWENMLQCVDRMMKTRMKLMLNNQKWIQLKQGRLQNNRRNQVSPKIESNFPFARSDINYTQKDKIRNSFSLKNFPFFFSKKNPQKNSKKIFHVFFLRNSINEKKGNLLISQVYFWKLMIKTLSGLYFFFSLFFPHKN